MRKFNSNIYKSRYSFIVLLIAILIIGYLVFSAIPLNVFSYDILGYYLYLPASFKYNDIALNNFDQIQSVLSTYHTSEGFYQAFKIENGNWVMKYPMGMAVMYYPFYVIGDNIAHLLKYPEDGFSLPYQLSVLYGCYLYTILGLVVLRKVLLHFFSDSIAAITLFFVVFGTNYLFHVSVHAQPAMSHNLLFTLHAITFFLTIKWHQSYKLKYMIGLGIVIGLTIITRPPEGLIICIPLLYNVYSINTFRQKIADIIIYKKQILLCIFIVLAIVSCQLIYWKLITGKYIFNSYGDHANEGFNFLHPYILEFLFSFRKGWLIYTPLMLFSVFGFYFIYKKNKDWFFACFIYFILSFYIICSWSCWWYGTSFSSRAIIPAYVVLSISLGFFINSILNCKIKFFLMPIFFLILFLNIFQSWQSANQILDGSRTTRAYYISTFLQTSQPTQEQKKLLLIDKYSTSGLLKFDENNLSNYKLVSEILDDFESYNKTQPFVVDSIYYSKNKSCITNKINPYSIDVTKSYQEITNKSYLICKVSANIFTREAPNLLDAELTLSMFHTYKCYEFKSMNIKNLNLKPNRWNSISFYYLTPDFWDKRDNLRAIFWNKSDQNIFVDDLKIEAYEPLVDETVF